MTQGSFVRRVSGLAGVGCLAGVAFATLSPIELRPHVASIGIEHVGAFFVLAILLGIAHPRHLVAVGVCLVVAAMGLELAQHLVPGRHGRIVDLVLKLMGTGMGLAAATLLHHAARRRGSRREGNLST
jgi:VanZ family protein